MYAIDVAQLASEKGIKMIHINARSLFHKIEDIFSNFCFCDIVVITETWLNSSIPSSAISVDGFSVIRQDRYENSLKKGGGICIYVNNEFTYEKLENRCVATSDYEMLGIKLKIQNIKPFYIMGTYRPPAGNMSNYVKWLNDVMEGIDMVRSELFILGDMNIDYKNMKLFKNLKLKHFETKFNLRQLIDIETRVTSSTATILDWVYTSTEYVSRSGVINYNISDHMPTFLVRKKPRNKIKKVIAIGRSYLRYNENIFKQKLEELSWDKFDNSTDPSEMWDCFEDNVNIVLDELCPIRNLTVPETKPDWLTNDIVQLMRRRDKMYKEARRKKDPVIWKKAIFLRNRVEMTIKAYKRDKIRNELVHNQNNPKKFWQNINCLLGKKDNVSIQQLVSEDGEIVYEGKLLSEYINGYFAEIGSKLANDIMTKINLNIDPVLVNGPPNANSDNISNKDITTVDLELFLNKVNINKSSAVSNIKTKVLVHAFHNQKNRIVRMYNGSLTLCTFPSKWKRATIVPLPKISNPKTVSDMRPISLLPFPGKIMEMIISQRLKAYLDENNILSKKQHGFRKKKSTLSAIVEFLHDVYMDQAILQDTFVVFLDLKKAFDTVSHKILLNKLKTIGLDEKSILWFQSYLGNRTQKTVINNNISSEMCITYGVPQGSILGPTLFTIYINDLANLIKGNINFYADDTILYSSDPVLLKSDLERTHEWCNKNLLTVNCKKSQWMKINLTNKKTDDTVLKLGDFQLQRVNEYKYLGVVIDSQLTFQTYRDSLINRVNLKISYFRKIRTYMTVKSALTLYKGTILPILEYADFVHDFNVKYISKKLQTIQNIGLYIAFNQHNLSYDLRESTETIHRRASLFRLAHRRKMHMVMFIFNYSNNPEMLDVRDIHTRRRNGILFDTSIVENHHHYKTKQDPMFRAMNAWNSLPVYIRNADAKHNLHTMLQNSINNPYSKIL